MISGSWDLLIFSALFILSSLLVKRAAAVHPRAIFILQLVLTRAKIKGSGSQLAGFGIKNLSKAVWFPVSQGNPTAFLAVGSPSSLNPASFCVRAAIAAVHGIPCSLPPGGIWPVQVFALAYIIFIIDLSPPLNYSPSGWGKTPFLSCLPSLLELLEFSHLVTSAERHPRTSPPACCTPALGTHWLLPSCLPNGLPWPPTVTEMCLSLGPVCPLSYCPHQAWLLCWLSFTQSPCQWAPSMPGLRESGMS